jgi:hypothetical protein
MGTSVDKPAARVEPGFQFVPARWLVVAFTVARLVLRRGKLAKVGILGLAWSVAPRKLRLVAGGLALAGAIVLLGALSAVALLVLRLS